MTSSRTDAYTGPAIIGPAITRDGRDWLLEMRQTFTAAARGTVSIFRERPAISSALRLSFLQFKVLTPAPIEMAAGTLIDYKLRVRGLPINWRTRIDSWNPSPSIHRHPTARPHTALWHHTHAFEADGTGTICTDIVRYRPPGGPLAPIINKLAVQRDVIRIFEHRSKWLDEHFRAR